MFLEAVQQAVEAGSVWAVLPDQLVHRFIQAASDLTTAQDQSDSEKMLRTSPLLDGGVHAHLVSVDDQQQRHKQLTQDQHHQQTQVLGKRKQRCHGGGQDVGASALRCYSPPSGAAPSRCERRCSR